MEVLIENPAVAEEFSRWCRHFGEDERYEVAGHIGLLDVLRAHFLIADYFWTMGSGIGGLGPRDANLLHSAVYRQFVGYGGQEKWQTPFERCATLVFGIVKDHPFHDANKRTALLVLLFFLYRVGRTPTSDKRELENFVVDIADGGLRRYRRHQDLQKRTDDPEVFFIADFLERNSRAVDRRTYTITYRELDARLRDFGFCLQNPRKNFIDICRIEQRRPLFGIGKPRNDYVRVHHMGFPGWKDQVGRGALAQLRKETKLTPEHGVDSETFFRGADPLNALIAEYSGPLRRLADR